MQRQWIAAFSVAFVVGTGLAAYRMLAPSDPVAPATVQALSPDGSTTTAGDGVAHAMVNTYQVGPAGSVTVSVYQGVVTVVRATGAAPWTVTDHSAPGPQVEVHFENGAASLSFFAGLQNGNLVVSLRNDSSTSPGSSSTTSIPMQVTQISNPTSGVPTTARGTTAGPTTTRATTTTHAPTTTTRPTPTTHPTTTTHPPTTTHPTTTTIRPVTSTTRPHPSTTDDGP